MKTYLLTLLMLSNIFVFAQVKDVTIEKLPGYSYKDTLYTQTEVWVQSYQEEIKQRREALNSERKIGGLRRIIKNKKSIDPIIDSLLTELNVVVHERDSLKEMVNKGLADLSVSMIETIDKYEAEIHLLNNKLSDAIDSKKYWRRMFWGSIAVIVIENGFILLLL